LGAVTLLRFIRVFRAIRVIAHAWKNIHLEEDLKEVIVVIFFVIFWVHVAACIWCAVGHKPDGWILYHDLADEKLVHKYIHAISYVLATLQGPTDMVPRNLYERACSFPIVLLSIVILSIVASKLTAAVISSAESRKKRSLIMRGCRDFMTQKRVPTGLAMEVMQQIRRGTHSGDMVDQEPDFTLLPIHLKRDLVCTARVCDICDHPVFLSMRLFKHRWYDRVACDVLRPAFHMPDSSLFITGEMSNTMYFVTRGEGTYWRNKKTIHRIFGVNPTNTPLAPHSNGDMNMLAEQIPIKFGDHLCEPALWCHWRHCGDFVVEVGVSTLDLNIQRFSDLLQCYPDMRTWAAGHAIRFVTSLHASAPCDLFDTEACMRMTFSYEA